MSNAESSEPDRSLDLSAAVPSGPEDRLAFRLGQLLLLLRVARSGNVSIPSVDRLAYYEFYSANPFIAVSGTDSRADGDRLTLRLAGFTSGQLAYAAAGQRFIGRRQRLQHDLSILIAHGMATVTGDGYEITAEGSGVVDQIQAEYADQFTASAEIILRRLRQLSDRRLRQESQKWLGSSWLLIDFLDDVREASVLVDPREASHNG